PQFDADGKKTSNARVTLRQNGVVIYDDLEIPKLTPGGRSHEASTGPLMLQNHGNPVVYRNIWVVETIRPERS
ncbi:MAG: family 16 glycoside hydrolase, partial [Pirellulales bacterium]